MSRNVFWIAPIVMMAIGIAPMPYGYYSISRLVVCGSALFFAISLHRQKDTAFVWIFSLVAILYNPIAPIHLYEKELWMLVNTVTAGLFIMRRKSIIQEESI